MHICLFEDHRSRQFLPLSYLRPVYDLRCGMLTLRERTLGFLSRLKPALHVRPYLASLVREENSGVPVNAVRDDACVFVNGRCVMEPRLARLLQKVKQDTLFVQGEDVVAARISGNRLAAMTSMLGGAVLDFTSLHDLDRVDVTAILVGYPWDLLYPPATLWEADFLLMTEKGGKALRKGKIHSSAVLAGKKRIMVGKKSAVGPGAVLDASDGPVVIGDGVTIMPGAVIVGPCSIGDGSTVKAGARIYGKTSLGPVCKVGGEVEHSVFQEYTNKQHDGFVGHSYLGEWVNLGAGTTTSNLKNTYGTVRVPLDGKALDSGKMFIGLIAGDHVKTGINSTLDTGTVIGPSSNLYGSSLHPKFVPAFSWGSAEQMQVYDLEKAIAVARLAMSRRGVPMSAAYEEALRTIFAMTEHELIATGA